MAGSAYGEGAYGDEGSPEWGVVLSSDAGGSTGTTGSAEGGSTAIGTASIIIDSGSTATGEATAVADAFSSMAVSIEISASVSELPELVEADTPQLQPLYYSHESDDLERELKELVMQLFENHIRDPERYVNALGMPHLGVRELIEAALSNNGIPIYGGASVADSAGAYLLRSWLAYNPKRGLHLLKTYLQMLWPNAATISQMWQEKAAPYPTSLLAYGDIPAGEDGGWYLTSRVHVTLPARVTTGGDVAAIQSGLRAALPARMVLNLAIEEEPTNLDVGIIPVSYRGAVAQSYEGSFK